MDEQEELLAYINEENKNFLTFKDECYLFNTIARGSDYIISKERIKNQLNLIKEELNEAYEALEENNPTKLLDSYCDIMVTSLGFGQQLQELGMDVHAACVETSGNNLTKFIWEEEDSDLALSTAKLDTKYYRDKGISVDYKYNEEFGCYVLKDHNNKVRKPVGYISNDLSTFTEDSINYV